MFELSTLLNIQVTVYTYIANLRISDYGIVYCLYDLNTTISFFTVDSFLITLSLCLHAKWDECRSMRCQSRSTPPKIIHTFVNSSVNVATTFNPFLNRVSPFENAVKMYEV